MHQVTSGEDHEAQPEPGTARRANGSPANPDIPSHYPLTAACRTCGQEIWRKTLLLHPWRHMNETGDPR